MANSSNDMMKKQSKWKQYVGAPKRFLSKARDFYVESMFSMDAKLGCSNMMIMPCPSPQISRITTINPGSDHSHNLKIREENTRTLCRSSTTVVSGGRSSYGKRDLVGRIETIDEDKPCEFLENHHQSVMFARSKSHAVTSSRNGYYFK